MQVPIGLEGGHEGVVDVVSRTAFYFKGVKGEVIEKGPVPANLTEKVEKVRQELIENLADVDEEVRLLFVLPIASVL
jgi:elongation factor G